MNALIIRYKIIVLSAMMSVGMGVNAEGVPTCSPCQAAANARLSAREAAASALSVAATVAKSMELDTSDLSVRAPREELPACTLCDTTVKPLNLCCIKQQLQRLVDNQAVCCAVINAKLDDQEEEAEKCCKKITHRLSQIEDLVVSIIDNPAVSCCSVVDNIQVLVGSQIDQSVACCSVMESQINNLNASIADIFVLVTSIFNCTCVQ